MGEKILEKMNTYLGLVFMTNADMHILELSLVVDQ